ncbi:MAG: M20/M25/M40 family metallo-hydrolase [Acidobacteria bacterium]|nr:M20/M25/M40 family metallo-hydrolase [Acidobacteriota bacterium]
MAKTRTLLLALALLAAPAIHAQSPRARMPDFDAAQDEAVRILQEVIRIDTSNPPGSETKVAQYIKGVLDKEGIPSEILELEPGRGNLVARIKGNGSRRPVLIMGHTDVVGVERDKWTLDPFAATIKDGMVWGRGAIDDKDTVSAGLMAFLLIHRMKVPLDRDVIYLAEAGEEGSSQLGIGFMVDEHFDKIDAEFALAEGGLTVTEGGKVKYVGVATTEKVGRGVRLVARGVSGHASRPRLDNAIVHLSAAVAKLGGWLPPMRLNETTRAFFQTLAKVSPPDEAFVYTHLEDPTMGLMAQELLRGTNVNYSSMLRTSISPTIVKGGFRGNVIPAEAEATLDIRALPDEDMDAFVDQMRRIVDDPAVEIVRNAGGRPAPPASGLDTEMFAALARAQAAAFPGAQTMPMMLTAATDNAQLRAKGVQAYGIGGPAPVDDTGMHGNDEKISVEGVGDFVELIYRAVVDVAAAGGAAAGAR